MKNNKYKHAVLKKNNGETQVSWIPAEFAQEGRYLKLKENGKWVDGWEVVKAYPAMVDGTFIFERGSDYKNHRKSTDI